MSSMNVHFSVSPWRLVLPALLVACGAAPVVAADGHPGQAEFDAAIDAKLAADGLDDYETVLRHCRKAIDLGLDEESKKFAEDLYTGTLVDRAVAIVDAISAPSGQERPWRALRDMALRDLTEVVERDPKMGQAHLMIAKLESLPEGNRARAVAAAKQAIELLGDDRVKKARAHLILGSLADDEEERGEHYDAAVELAPRDGEVRRTRGVFLLFENQFEKAREDLAAAIEQEADDPALHEALGMACMMSDHPAEARKAFDRAIELAPTTVGPLLQRARLLAVDGKHAEAIADIDRALKIDRGNAGALVLRARIHQQAGNADQALADVEAVLAASPDNESALELRGLLAADREDYQAAIIDFRRLAAKRSDDPVLIAQLASLYLAAKQPREAIKRFSRALEIDADSLPSRRGRSDAAISIGDHRAALVDLERALELKPDDTGVLNNLAWLLATSPDDGLRNGERAIELARKACEITEWKQPHIISTLAAGYAEKGDFESARKFSRQAVEATDDSDAVRKQLEGELASYEAEKAWRERQEMEEGAADAGRDSPDEPAIPAGRAERAPDAEGPRPPRRPFDEE